MRRSTLLGLVLVGTMFIGLGVSQLVSAQNATPQAPCDVDAVIAHQQEHAKELENFAAQAKTDLNGALEQLYRTAIAYQALAVECGITQQEETQVEAVHQWEHSGVFDDNATTDIHEHSPEEEAAVLARARTVGDPDQGKILFNTVRPEVSFACATCHRADSTETLVGPGLLGISGHTHNHGAAAGSMAGMDMSGATATPDTMAGMNMGATATPDSMAGMTMGEATPEATAAPERTFEQTVEFLRISIVNPGFEVMTGFPDNLMPKVYGTIFTTQEINNLIAYLLTLD